MRTLNVIEQFCMSHVIPLGIYDILYKVPDFHEVEFDSNEDEDENNNFIGISDSEKLHKESDIIDFHPVLKNVCDVVKLTWNSMA